MNGRRALFLDRDGTLIVDVPYLSSPEKVEVLPGAARAVRDLSAAGLLVILMTNQSAIARGLLVAEGLAAVHARLAELLAREGAHLDAIYYCPHLPHEELPPGTPPCACRKPLPGLARRAEREWGLDLSRSFFVGDRRTDVQIAGYVGGTGILVRTGHGWEEEKQLVDPPDFRVWVVDDLPMAAERVLASLGKEAQAREAP